MSNDLISRSNVIKIIEDEMKEKLSYDVHNAQIDILFKVKELPTAYDVDKVVERLENEVTATKTKCPVNVEFDIGIYKAIEIVKEGAKD